MHYGTGGVRTYCLVLWLSAFVVLYDSDCGAIGQVPGEEGLIKLFTSMPHALCGHRGK